MEEQKNLVSVFDKLNDLKSLFRFGEKIVPIIQSLVEFMKDIIPLLDTINTSIADSTSKMPIASNQINDVTNATEMATTQILDLVDEISNELEAIETALIGEKERQENIEQLALSLFAALEGNPDLQEKLSKLLELTKDRRIIETVIPLIEAIREDSYKITMALQVQDITAQQLAAVNHLISSVHGKLSMIVADIEKSDLNSEMGRENNPSLQVADGTNFDANASFTRGGMQQQVDDLVRENNLRTKS